MPSSKLVDLMVYFLFSPPRIVNVSGFSLVLICIGWMWALFIVVNVIQCALTYLLSYYRWLHFKAVFLKLSVMKDPQFLKLDLLWNGCRQLFTVYCHLCWSRIFCWEMDWKLCCFILLFVFMLRVSTFMHHHGQENIGYAIACFWYKWNYLKIIFFDFAYWF